MDSNPQPIKAQNPWLGRMIVALLCAQLGLTWLQGRLLHQQHQDLQDLRGEIQFLTDSIEQGSAEAMLDEMSLAPAKVPLRRCRRSFVRVARVSPQEEKPEQAAKDLEASRASAQKAVKDAREVQSKLSLSENARKAEEKAKVQGVQHSGAKWLLVALGGGLLALVVRAWLRRRG